MAVPKVTRSYTAGFREKHKIVENVQKLGALSPRIQRLLRTISATLQRATASLREGTAGKLPEVSGCCLCAPSGHPPLGIEEAHILSTRNSAKSARRK